MICWEENRLLIKKKKKTFSLPKKECIVFSSSESLTHHDSSDADAHVPDDVEFAVEEVLDACLTVLRDKEHWWFVHYSLDNKEAELIFFFVLSQEPGIDLTLVFGLASGQGLAMVPQQFSWKTEKTNTLKNREHAANSFALWNWCALFLHKEHFFFFYLPLSGMTWSVCCYCFHCMLFHRSSERLR